MAHHPLDPARDYGQHLSLMISAHHRTTIAGTRVQGRWHHRRGFGAFTVGVGRGRAMPGPLYSQANGVCHLVLRHPETDGGHTEDAAGQQGARTPCTPHHAHAVGITKCRSCAVATRQEEHHAFVRIAAHTHCCTPACSTWIPWRAFMHAHMHACMCVRVCVCVCVCVSVCVCHPLCPAVAGIVRACMWRRSSSNTPIPVV